MNRCKRKETRSEKIFHFEFFVNSEFLIFKVENFDETKHFYFGHWSICIYLHVTSFISYSMFIYNML